MNEQAIAAQLTPQERECLEYLWQYQDTVPPAADRTLLARLLAWELIEPVPQLLLPVLPAQGGYRLTEQGRAVLKRLHDGRA